VYETDRLNLAAYDNQTVGSYTWIFNDSEAPSNNSDWKKDKNNNLTYIGNTSSITSSQLTTNDNGASFVAYLKPIYSATFQGSNPITVNGNNYNGSAIVQVVKNNSVTATASDYFISSDWISNSFINWTWPGGSSTNRTITPTLTGNTTYTANYTGTANPSPMNIHYTNSNGEYISLAWTEHPSTGVTQYQVWRAVSGGSTSALATLNRGTTSYTDHLYIQNPNGATKLFYTVKAYYAPSGTWNDPGYLLNRGDIYDPKIEHNHNNDQLNVSNKEVPLEYSIGNYPNPFNPTTTINYQLPNDGFVTIKVYDLLGREVATLVNENKTAGYYNVGFNASKLTSGIYIYTITANNFVQSKKMLLMK
jgi:hypothetical protein